ncbi:hypothetical protein HZP91_15340 [Elizabethkingia anophelis]|nr:hypothetical protein [Elizabethkingia anophelis]
MKTLTIKNKEVTISQLVDKIKYNLKNVQDGFASQYIVVEIVDGDDYDTFKIRVSDHSAKKQNNGDTKTLSFITERCDQGYSSMMYNEYVVDDIEDMNTNETTSRGWLSVEEIIEDFIDDFKF